jgi:ammonia channel protein AmtB
MSEVIAGALLLILAWLCFGQASRMRAATRSRPRVEMPKFVIKTLGSLPALSGLSLLTLALS